MLYAFIGNIFLVMVLIIVVHSTLTKQKRINSTQFPNIHKSGIYSIVRKSPRGRVNECKPSLEEINRYLESQKADVNGNKLLKRDIEALLDLWKRSMEENISVVEEGDKEGLEFYYYEFAENDPACTKFITKGQFVSREEIYKFPRIIPPFHLGCRCKLRGLYGSSESIRETIRTRMRPFFTGESHPHLPAWRKIVKC